MKAITIYLLALLMFVPALSRAQDEQAISDQERVALQQALEQARQDIAQAARRIARIQRRLADEDWQGDWREQEIEAVSGKPVDRIILNRRRHLVRPRLGILLGSGADKGDVVVGLTPGSGAETAGIRPGDRIVAIDGQAIDPADPGSFRRPLAGAESGDLVPLELERDGVRLALEVELSSPVPGRRAFERKITRDGEVKTEIMLFSSSGEESTQPDSSAALRLPRLAGLGRHSDMISNHEGLEPYFGTAAGVIVLRIDADNPLKLVDGDVVLSIDGEAVSRPVEIGRALLGSGGETVTFEVMRGGERITFDAELPAAKAVSAFVRPDSSGP